MHRLLIRQRGPLVAAVAGGVAAAISCNRGAAAESESAATRRPRVLITGFHDWRELDGNIWRCRDNPSCRLILGECCASPPISRNGPLPQALRASVDADFTFVTLPVLWGASAGLDLLSYDLVIHMGLGVYDRHDTILVENDAYNLRQGQDALAHSPPGHTIEMGAPQVLVQGSAMQGRYAALAANASAALPGGFVLSLAPARVSNSYICNETHWRALKARERAEVEAPSLSPSSHGAVLGASYFVHLPYARDDEKDHRQLAAAVAEVIRRIVQLEARA